MRPRDGLVIRSGWEETEDMLASEGATEEIALAVEMGLNIAYDRHGEDVLREGLMRVAKTGALA